MSSRNVIPLESNPDIFNQISKKLGLSPILKFHDVFSITEPDLLAFLSQPIFAIIMLLPITGAYESDRIQSDAEKKSEVHADLGDIIWFKQTISNACGLYAVLHILSNLPQDFIIENSIFKSILMKNLTKESTQADVSRLVDQLEQKIQLDSNYGSQGQTNAPEASEPVGLHFITFIKGKDNHLYELDGRRTGPVDLGKCSTDDNIIHETSLVEKIKFYMNTTDKENEHNFALMSIAPSIE